MKAQEATESFGGEVEKRNRLLEWLKTTPMYVDEEESGIVISCLYLDRTLNDMGGGYVKKPLAVIPKEFPSDMPSGMTVAEILLFGFKNGIDARRHQIDMANMRNGYEKEIKELKRKTPHRRAYRHIESTRNILSKILEQFPPED